MSTDDPESGVRVRRGEGVLELCGEEAAGLGSRALVLSSVRPEPRDAGALDALARILRRGRVGHHPFPRVPLPGAALSGCVGLAAEAGRESRCRLVIGVGDREPLEAARAAAARTLLPCLLVPTAVGYGLPAGTRTMPLPEVLILDPRVTLGSPPRRTAILGVALFAGLLERFVAGEDPAAPEALRLLVDHLPGAVGSPDDMAPRAGLARAVEAAARAMDGAGEPPPFIEEILRRLAPTRAEADGLRSGLVTALLAAGAEDRGPVGRARVAGLGRQVLSVREDDDGRAASWAAGGIRQWVINLGLDPVLPSSLSSRAGGDAALLALMTAARPS